jgi:YVTN family beta-propeller protein
MRLLDGFSRAGVVRLTGVLVAAVAVAACCVSVSSAAIGVIRTIPVGKEPRYVSSDGAHVWVTNLNEETVSEIDASSGKVIRTIKVGDLPSGVSSDGTHVWVGNHDSGTVSEIEASSGKVINTIPVAGSGPEGVSSDGTDVWVAEWGPDTVSEIEASSGAVIRRISVGSHPVGVSFDGTDVWVANSYEETVSEIEASSGKVINTIKVGSDPYGVSSDGTHVWVTNYGEETVSEIEASSGKVINTIKVGSKPWGVSSYGTEVWVANVGADTVSEIEASSGTVINTIPVGSAPVGVSSDGTHVWVTNASADTVGEIGPQPAPEFGRCVKVTEHTGRYGSDSCTKLGGDGSYDWEPGVVKTGFTTSSGTFTIQPVVKASEVTCKHEASDGEITGAQTVGGVVLALTGCEKARDECQSAGATHAGEIISSTLEGELGVEKLGGTSLQDKIGLDLFPVGKTGALIAFNCGSGNVSVEGSVIVPFAKVNKTEHAFTLKAKESKGKQKPEQFVGGPKEVLVIGPPTEQAGLSALMSLLTEEDIEVNTVF